MEQTLEQTAAGLREAGLAARAMTESGFAASTIARVAREQEIDLIAMASHGRGGLARVVLGSVATGVIQQASVPLLLVRASSAAQASAAQVVEAEGSAPAEQKVTSQ